LLDSEEQRLLILCVFLPEARRQAGRARRELVSANSKLRMLLMFSAQRSSFEFSSANIPDAALVDQNDTQLAAEFWFLSEIPVVS
jgi:hypothetical protein